MNAVKYCCMTAAVLVQSQVLYAAPADYAWKAALESKDGELNKLLIGADIIRGLGRGDFGDLVVLDANGTALPSWVRPIQQVTELIEVPLYFHTFSEYSGSRSKTVTATNESRSEDSRSTIRTTETVREAKASNAFIVEYRDYQLALGINALRLDWTTKDEAQLLELRVEASNSLNKWQTVHNRITLAKAKTDSGNNLDWQLVRNIPTEKRYIRISSADPELTIALNAVSGLYEEPTLETIEWIPHASAESDSAGENSYRFAIPEGVLPSRMRLQPAQENQIIKGSIFAGEKYNNKRTLYPNVQQHSLAAAANIIASPSYAVPSQRYDHWWFVSEATLQEAPLFEIGYKRQQLLFLANGTPPYTLYWGNHEAEPPAQLLRDVLNGDKKQGDAHKASLAKIEISGGAQRQFPQPTLPWLTWALWLLLTIAAIFTARMAIGLFREMK
ncbi:MAG: DUF3999 family protein [Pseudomonadota bacterium]